jgi:sensor c-di-GMP phosphodiesterase-like protein
MADVESAIADVRASMAHYAGGDDSPPARVMNAMLELATRIALTQDALERRVEAARSLPLPEIEAAMSRAAGRALSQMRPLAEKRWRWQRWAAVCAAAVISTVALISGTWYVSSDSATRQDVSEAAHWQAWCAAPQNIRTLPDGRFCVVPVERSTNVR